MQQESLRMTVVHPSMNRNNLFMGGDREMTMFVALICNALVFTALQWATTFFGIFLWLFSLFILRLMAKSDVKMRQVYLRHIRYQKYYPPRSRPWRENTASQTNNYK